MNSGFSVLAMLGMTGMLLFAGCEQVTDLGRNPEGLTGGGGLIGDPCTPRDEDEASFSGYGIDEVSIETGSPECGANICLINHFQGRVSCPYGNDLSEVNIAKGETPPGCNLPGTTDPITVAVDPQLAQRQARDAVYCSCRCDGPDRNARYCDCPSGFSCVPLVDDLGQGEGAELAGSYCVRKNTTFDKNRVDVADTCTISGLNCGQITDTGEPE